MNSLPASWHLAIAIRKSRRSFHPRRPEEEKLVRLENACRTFRPYPGVRAEFVRKPPEEVFRGLIGGYGRITGASFYMAFIGALDAPYAAEAVGYTGEGLILEATMLGLGTCWVSGFFRSAAVRSHLSLPANERVFAVTPIGYAERELTLKDKVYRTLARSARRKPLEDLVVGPLAEPWQRAAVEAARSAPSASNRQPWRFVPSPGSLTVRTDGGADSGRFPKRLDCGIAMMHVELGARSAGAPGRWTLLAAPDVARYDVSA